MATPGDPLALSDWRRTVAELYAAVRYSSETDPQAGWRHWRQIRDNLFKRHPQSPLDEEQRHAFQALPYYDYDPSWRLVGQVEKVTAAAGRQVALPADGLFRYTQIGRVQFAHLGEAAELALFWVEGYGGGLFLPFQDATGSDGTYGGGRYLYDTIKGADLGAGDGQIMLDFNFAYNPSCAYNARWVCPLSPPENRLSLAVTAGEKRFE